MLSAKMHLLMKRLDDRASEKNELVNYSRMTYEECGDTRHSGNHCPTLQEDVSYLNNNNYNRPQQNHGWNQQRSKYSTNYSSGNYQGNNFSNNFNQPPLRELVVNQGKLMDNLSMKISSSDKILETMNTRMDNFATAIKNQHSFNKMIESPISQLITDVPTANQGKILGQPEELECENLVDIYNVGKYFRAVSTRGWKDESMPEKKGGPRRSVIPINIGGNHFLEVLCDFGANVNIMPNVLYEKIHGDPLLYTTMCLQMAD